MMGRISPPVAAVLTSRERSADGAIVWPKVVPFVGESLVMKFVESLKFANGTGMVSVDREVPNRTVSDPGVMIAAIGMVLPAHPLLSA